MSLRQRLLVTTLAVAVPLAIVLFWVASRSRQANQLQSLERLISAELDAGLVSRCETEGGLPPPGGRGRGGPPGRGRGGPPAAGPANPAGTDPFEVVPYTREFALARRGPGPAFPDSLKEALRRDGRAVGPFVTPQGRGLQLAVRLSGTDGPCDILLARVRPRIGESRDQLIALGSILFIVIAAIWMATGPTIARIRKLAGHVRTSAASHYEVAVPESGRDEVAALAHAFNEAGRDIKAHLTDVEARATTLREFVANTTHDVAVPLTVLQGHLASLERADLPDAEADRVRNAIREAHYMGSLLRNLATASRLEGAVPVERIQVDLGALVERVVERHTPVARAAGVELNFAVPEAPLPVMADPTLVEQAIGNLVDNAIRYNHHGGHVAVVLDRPGEDDGTFHLTVTDDGPGVRADELPRLATRRFRSDDARSRRPDGQGIGLAIAAETTALMGWTLRFHDNAPSGLVAEIRS